MPYADSQLSELQIAVKRKNLAFVQNFLDTSKGPGTRRCVMGAACLFDDVEVADMCVKARWTYDYYTILTALEEGAIKVAEFLYEKALNRDLNETVSKNVFGIINRSTRPLSNRCKAARWLISKGFRFYHGDLRCLAIRNEFELFKILFDEIWKGCTPECVPYYKEIFEACIRYRAYTNAEFLENILGFDIEQTRLEKGLVCNYAEYKTERVKRDRAAIVIQMVWQNYRRRKDPSIALKEAAESWDKLVSEFPEKFV